AQCHWLIQVSVNVVKHFLYSGQTVVFTHYLASCDFILAKREVHFLTCFAETSAINKKDCNQPFYYCFN
ncbi:MAG: hypothetical protein K2N36_06850, partial [Ruminiclostridium sp.]|nr:hypothetical protein [Ruminiclostridium sp.]